MEDIVAPETAGLTNPDIVRKLEFLSQVAAVFLLLLACLVNLGWALDVEVLKRLSKDYVAMNPATAVLFAVASIGLWFLHSPTEKKGLIVRICGLIIGLVGLLKLISVLTQMQFPFDQWLFAKQLDEPTYQRTNYMSPNDALCFLLAGTGILLIDWETQKGQRPAQYFSIVITLIALVSLYGYVYDVKYLIGVSSYLPMALHTAFGFLILAVGMLFARPDKGTMAVIFSDQTGEMLFFHLIVLVLPLIFGWLKIKGENAGLYTKEYGTAVFAVVTYTISMILLGNNQLMKYRIRKVREQANKVVRDKEKLLQSVLSNLGEGVSVADTKGNFLYVNQMAEKLEGPHKREDEITEWPKEFGIFRPDAKTPFPYDELPLFRAFQGESLDNVDMFIRNHYHPGGKYLSVTGRPIRNEEGKIVAGVVVFRDVTERRQMQAKLEENDQRLKAVLSSIGEGVIVADQQGKLVIFNPAAEALLGKNATEIPATKWSDVYGVFRPDGITPFPFEELPLYLAIHGEAANEVTMFIKNESIPEGKMICGTGRPVIDESGNVVAGVVNLWDLTEKIQMQKKLKELQVKIAQFTKSR